MKLKCRGRRKQKEVKKVCHPRDRITSICCEQKAQRIERTCEQFHQRWHQHQRQWQKQMPPSVVVPRAWEAKVARYMGYGKYITQAFVSWPTVQKRHGRELDGNAICMNGREKNKLLNTHTYEKSGLNFLQKLGKIGKNRECFCVKKSCILKMLTIFHLLVVYIRSGQICLM